MPRQKWNMNLWGICAVLAYKRARIYCSIMRHYLQTRLWASPPGDYIMGPGSFCSVITSALVFTAQLALTHTYYSRSETVRGFESVL